MSTALKAMKQKMKAEKALYGPINRRGFSGKVDYWNKLIALDINDANVPEYLSGYDPEIVTRNPNYDYSGLIGTSADYQHTRNSLKTEEKQTDRKCSYLRIVKRIGINREQGFGVKAERGLEMLSRLTRSVWQPT